MWSENVFSGKASAVYTIHSKGKSNFVAANSFQVKLAKKKQRERFQLTG